MLIATCITKWHKVLISKTWWLVKVLMKCNLLARWVFGVSCGHQIFKENCFIFHMLFFKLFIWAGRKGINSTLWMSTFQILSKSLMKGIVKVKKFLNFILLVCKTFFICKWNGIALEVPRCHWNYLIKLVLIKDYESAFDAVTLIQIP